MIVGIDEVGRGAWAGPMAVGAVILGGATIVGLTDSKKLTKKRRAELDIEIRQQATAIGIGWVSARQIDQIGLSAALKLAARRALGHIQHEYHEIIIDGTVALIDDPRVTLMKKADLLVPSVSAASIVAKVARDNYMKHLDTVFPGYKFAAHVGYGTAMHRKVIEAQGVTPLHRLSYIPLAQYERPMSVGPTFAENDPTLSAVVTTKQIGDTAEDEATNYLLRHGHEIITRNWRTKFCEIDIISRHGDTVYFTEVKYRKTDAHGGGLAAITAKKRRQMTFAAEYYALKNNLANINLRLAAADVTGRPPQVKSFLKLG
jgi:ribonuclease HII